MCDSEVMYHSILCKSRNDFPLFSCGSSLKGHVLLLMLAEEAAAAKNRKQELIDYMRTFKKHQIFSSATRRGVLKR